MLTVARKMLGASPKLAAAIVAGATLVSFAPAANAVPVTSYSTAGAPAQMSLGDTLGTGFDKLTIQAASGDITTLATSTITLNALTFTAGVNAIVPAIYNGVYSFTENVTVGGVTQVLTVPFNLSINSSDTLTIAGGTTLSFLVGANVWNLVLNGLTIGPNSGGSEVGYLTAQISDPPAATPLPAALLLFGTGLGAMGIFGRRRKLKASAVSAA
jgi:hypothetical protein